MVSDDFDLDKQLFNFEPRNSANFWVPFHAQGIESKHRKHTQHNTHSNITHMQARKKKHVNQDLSVVFCNIFFSKKYIRQQKTLTAKHPVKLTEKQNPQNFWEIPSAPPQKETTKPASCPPCDPARSCCFPRREKFPRSSLCNTCQVSKGMPPLVLPSLENCRKWVWTKNRLHIEL